MRIFNSAIFYLLILTVFLSFKLADTPPPPSGWYQQFMPITPNWAMRDITFVDSATGYASILFSDTSYILKTTNSGNNWQIVHMQYQLMTHLQFINTQTGFAGGGYLYKTTNGGTNWTIMNSSISPFVDDIYVLNIDTLLFVTLDGIMSRGVYRTTNSGNNWIKQSEIGSRNIYMCDARNGFIDAGKTTNGGENWIYIPIQGHPQAIYFIDSLTGWRCGSQMEKTTDGGFTWTNQIIPSGGNIEHGSLGTISCINKDTLWVGSSYYYHFGYLLCGILFRTTNGGTNWLFQIPDTSFHIMQFNHIYFMNEKIGWAYSLNVGGIHTTTGGDPTWYTGIQQTPNAVPEGFVLKQNYPNPFNPRTVIPYNLSAPAYVKIIAYDITGREVQRMVDQYQQAGAYEVDFMGKFTASGVYFYRMTVTDEKAKAVYMETKKMILLK